MPFERGNLTRIEAVNAASGTRHNSIWYYVTPDTSIGTGYFNSAWRDFVVGDVIDVVTSIGSTPALRRYVVTAVSTNSVTIALQSTT